MTKKSCTTCMFAELAESSDRCGMCNNYDGWNPVSPFKLFCYTGTGARLNCSVIVAATGLEEALELVKRGLWEEGEIEIDEYPDIEEIDVIESKLIYMDLGG